MTASKASGSSIAGAVRRTRTSALPPAAISSTCRTAHLVPVAAGFTAPPETTQSLIAAFGYGPSDSFTQNSDSPSAYSRHSPSSACAATAPPGAAASEGLGESSPHDQVLRNHSVGSTCTVAASGPRLWTVTSRQRSSWAAFAYSTTTSK